MRTKDEKVQQFKWQTENRLAMIRAQIEEIRPMKKTDGLTWWHEYTDLKTKECIAEQDLEWCRKYLKEE